MNRRATMRVETSSSRSPAVPRPAPDAAARARAPRRILFIDVARAAAVLFMIQGHTLQVLLGPDHQGGALFDWWLYLRGLTSCAFLTLAGFSFAVATDRHWTDYCRPTSRLRRRLMRFGVFLLVGYAMRIPIRPLSDIGHMTLDQWRAFTAIDILQLVAVTLATLQVVVWLARTRQRLGAWAFGAAAAIVLLTPLAWRVHSGGFVADLLAAYLSTGTGSLFPLFPWAAYILFGAGLGVWFVTRAQPDPARDASRVFLLAGAGMLGAGILLHQVPLSPYGAIDFWKTSPNLFLVKAGSVLVMLSGAVRLTRWRSALPRPVSVLSQESLTIYVIHVCILYGSIWNDGLLKVVGPHLDLVATAGWVVVLTFAMLLVASAWHECKQRSGRLSALVRATLAVGLIYAIS